MRSIHTDAAPKAIGPYSQAVEAGDLVFCSGQIALDPKGGELIAGGAKEQSTQALENLSEILQAAGSGLADVVSVTVYLASMSDFKDMNDVYAAAFGEHKPARVTVGVSELPKNALVEISCIAKKTV